MRVECSFSLLVILLFATSLNCIKLEKKYPIKKKVMIVTHTNYYCITHMLPHGPKSCFKNTISKESVYEVCKKNFLKRKLEENMHVWQTTRR